MFSGPPPFDIHARARERERERERERGGRIGYIQYWVFWVGSKWRGTAGCLVLTWGLSFHQTDSWTSSISGVVAS